MEEDCRAGLSGAENEDSVFQGHFRDGCVTAAENVLEYQKDEICLSLSYKFHYTTQYSPLILGPVLGKNPTSRDTD